MMPRYCLLGRVDPNRLDEYREAHRAVWPELLEALRDAGEGPQATISLVLPRTLFLARRRRPGATAGGGGAEQGR